MDFARKQLLKYGWSEGKGLGKNESGIAEALKPSLKFDTTGVGHDPSEQFTFNWWENVYNQAADNIKVEKSNCGSVNLKLNSEDSIDITTKKLSYKHFKKSNINLEYGSFLKTSKLVPDLGVVDHEEKMKNSYEPMETVKVANLTDEELFAACGGRTAHKGARHGLKLNGKLARIEEQEMLLLQKMKQKANNLNIENNKIDNKYSLLFDNDAQKVKHKKKKKKEKNNCEFDEIEMKKQKKAKKRKSQPDNSDNDDEVKQFIEEEAARKRTEYICAKQRKKKMECLKNREKKRLNNMTNLFENVCSVNVQDNKDDGFVENTNDDETERQTKIKSKKKRRKHNREEATDENDDGFEECINEVSEKLIHYKELRMNLQKEKKKGDDNRISKMAEEFKNTL